GQRFSVPSVIDSPACGTRTSSIDMGDLVLGKSLIQVATASRERERPEFSPVAHAPGSPRYAPGSPGCYPVASPGFTVLVAGLPWPSPLAPWPSTHPTYPGPIGP